MVPIPPPKKGYIPNHKVWDNMNRITPNVKYSRLENTWQCEYCNKPNQNVDRCTECDAPRTAEKEKIARKLPPKPELPLCRSVKGWE